MNAGVRDAWPVLAALVGIVLAVAWIAHALDRRAAAGEEVETTVMELSHKADMAANRDVLTRVLAELELMLASTRERLPATFDAGKLRRALEESAAEHDVQIASATFGTEDVKEFYAEQPVQLSVSGPAAGVYAFLADISAAAPVRAVCALRLMPADAQRTALAAELEVAVFRFVEDVEATEPVE